MDGQIRQHMHTDLEFHQLYIQYVYFSFQIFIINQTLDLFAENLSISYSLNRPILHLIDAIF